MAGRRKVSRFGRVLGVLGFGGKKRKADVKPRRRTLSCEPLEQRQLLSVAVWTGQGQNNRWSTAQNWQGNVAPLAGDSLVFSGTAQTATCNDLAAGTSFQSIEFQSTGFSISGNSLALPDGGTITLDTGSAGISANLVAAGELDTVANPGSTLTVSGVISEAAPGAGSLDLDGGGQLVLTASNTFSGGTEIDNASQMLLSGGDNRLAAAGGIDINGGTLDLGGHSQTNRRGPLVRPRRGLRPQHGPGRHAGARRFDRPPRRGRHLLRWKRHDRCRSSSSRAAAPPRIGQCRRPTH